MYIMLTHLQIGGTDLLWLQQSESQCSWGQHAEQQNGTGQTSSDVTPGHWYKVTLFFLKETQKKADLKSVPWFQHTQLITANGRWEEGLHRTNNRREGGGRKWARKKRQTKNRRIAELRLLSQRSKSAKWSSLICSHGSAVVLYCFTSHVRHKKGVTCYMRVWKCVGD